MPTAESSATNIIGSYCHIAGGEIKVVRVGVGSHAHFRYKDNKTYIWGSML